MMTLNIGRDHPIYFSNNVLEAIRDRIFILTNSITPSHLEWLKPEDGIKAIDSLLDYIVKQPKMKGLFWNHNLE